MWLSWWRCLGAVGTRDRSERIDIRCYNEVWSSLRPHRYAAGFLKMRLGSNQYAIEEFHRAVAFVTEVSAAVG